MSQKIFVAFLAALTVSLTMSSLEAQVPAFRATGPSTASVGATFEAAILLDAPATELQGWAYGVCIDPTLLQIESVALGSTALTANGGDSIFFHQLQITADGYTVGALISGTGANNLPPGNDYELSIGSYTALAETTTTSISPCDGQGAPPVQSIVVENGQPIPTDLIPHSLGIEFPQLAYTAIAPDTQATYRATGELEFSVTVLLDQIDNGFPLSQTQGFSLGLGHDPALLQVTGLESALPFEPDFIQFGLSEPNGWTVGVVYSLTGAVELALVDQPAITATYTNTTPSPLAGNDQPVMTTLEWSDSIGNPPVVNVIVVQGASFAPEFDDGIVTLDPPPPIPEFRRGDANQDATVDLSDGIWMLNELFQGGPSFDCSGAMDVNFDGQYNAADAISIFSWLFLFGPPPAAPFPDCGLPVKPRVLCNSYDGC